MDQGLQCRIVSGPADTVETDVAPSDRGAEPILAQARQDNDKITGSQAELGEGAIEPFAKQLGYVFATRKLDENETAVTHLSGDPRKNRIIISRHVREPDQPLGVVLVTVGRLHQLAAEKIV